MGWPGAALSRRQDTQPQCVVNQKVSFTLNQTLRGRCRDPSDNACLCSQRGQDSTPIPFYGYFLTRLCTSCPVGELQGKEPLEYLADECPELASELEGRYTCVPGATDFPTLSPTASRVESLPSLTSLSLPPPTVIFPSRTSTVVYIGPSHPSSPFSISTASANPTAPNAQASTTGSNLAPSVAVSKEKNGLSTGAVAGIAIAVAVPIMLLIIAAVFFCLRRRKHSQKSWQAERSLSPELYDENGIETAYGAQMNVKPIRDQAQSPILREKERQSAHIIETREIHDDDEAMDGGAGLQNVREIPNTTREQSVEVDERPEVGQAVTGALKQHSRGIPGTKAASGVITRKEVPTRNSVPVLPSSRVHSPPPLSHNSQSRQENRSSSRISGTLRGPVPDMYAYAGVTIENEEELERLEEEERRIDEAIRESESRAQMRVEKEDIRARIQGLRDSM